jgi:hypothetical protein
MFRARTDALGSESSSTNDHDSCPLTFLISGTMLNRAIALTGRGNYEIGDMARKF